MTRKQRRRPRSTRDSSVCSFCGIPKDEVERLIAGPGVYICNVCVDLCNEIIKEERAATT